MYVSRVLSGHRCALITNSTLWRPQLAAAWPRKHIKSSLIAVSAQQRKKKGRQAADSGVDSTTELLLDSVQSSKGDVLDIDELLNDEAALSALRGMLKAEMAAAQRSASGAAAATASSASRQQQQQPERPRRAFDSDEYDSEALDTVYEVESSSVDEITRDAASSLLHESQDIAEHILHEHQGDGMLDEQQQQRSSKRSNKPSSSSSSSSQGRDGTFILRLPDFATGRAKNADRDIQQQQQQGRGSKGRTANGPGSSSSSSGRGGRGNGSSQGQGGRGSGSGGSRGDGDFRGPRTLSPDSAIGRVCEAKGNVPIVVLKKGKERLFDKLGSPMVYGGAVECVVGRPPPSAGDVVAVADYHMVPIGWGVFNPVSMFRVRMLQSEVEALSCADEVVLDLERLLDLRLAQAVALRSSLGFPSASTNAYRVVNSEGDRLSGLTVDALGDVLVAQSCAAWTERYRDTIIPLLLKHTGASRVVWRPSAGILKEEGIDLDSSSSSSSSSGGGEGGSAAAAASSTEEDVSPLATLADADSSSSSSSSSSERQPAGASSSSKSRHETVEVQEAGLTFLATPEAGQKTGFYADQRQNRAFIAGLSKGKTVLDLCCYSGGFALMAAAAGAAAVTGVDSSASAVQLAQDNAELNGLTDRCAFVRDDVSTFLRAALEAGESWDVVVLDPPKLAPNKASLPRASSKYRRLNELALGVVKSGGVLMTCSCSGAMTQSGGLGKVVQEAATAAERQVTLLSKAGAAADHPLNPGYPEGEYLTALTYRVV